MKKVQWKRFRTRERPTSVPCPSVKSVGLRKETQVDMTFVLKKGISRKVRYSVT